MANLLDFFWLLLLLAVIASWLKLHRAREQATAEARRQCERYGLQLLDETVGLRSLKLRRVAGRLGIERGYGFDVSIDGDDREPGQLWLVGEGLTGLRLPTIELHLPEARTHHVDTRTPVDSNVVPLRPRDKHLH